MKESNLPSDSSVFEELTRNSEIEAVSALLIYVEELLKEQGGHEAARAVFDADSVLRAEFSLPTRFEELATTRLHGHS